MADYTPEFQNVPVANLIVSSEQRDLKPKHVERLTKEWDATRCEPLAVSGPDDAGKLHVVEGQHRLRAAEALGLKTLPCMVHPLMGEADRMALHFDLQGTKKADSAYDKWRMKSGDNRHPEHTKVAEWLADEGFSVGQGGSSSSHLGCPAALDRQTGKYGAATVTRAIDVLDTAFGRHASTWQAYAVDGMCELLGRHPSIIDNDARFAAKIAKDFGGVDTLIARMNGRVKGTGGTGSRGMTVARLLAESWNRGIRTESKRIPDNFLGIARDVASEDSAED